MFSKHFELLCSKSFFHTVYCLVLLLLLPCGWCCCGKNVSTLDAMIVLNGPELICNCKYTYHYTSISSLSITLFLSLSLTLVFCRWCLHPTKNPFGIIHLYAVWNTYANERAELSNPIHSAVCLGMCKKVKLVNFNSLFLLLCGFHHCTFQARSSAFRLSVTIAVVVVLYLSSFLPLPSLLLGGLYMCVRERLHTINTNIGMIQNSRMKRIATAAPTTTASKTI